MSTHNFIVTGGCGFIGGHFYRVSLVLHGQNVLLLMTVVKDITR